jgi:hypothetical protein
MSTNCYQIACEHATNEIAEINAQIQRLTRRKELLEKLLEPLKLLVPESGSVAFPVTVSDGSNSEFSATEVATQLSPAVLLADDSGPEPAWLVAPAPKLQPEVEETNLHARRNGGTISHEDIAGLAYRFWIERGQVHGNHEPDWFRAEHELQNPAY